MSIEKYNGIVKKYNGIVKIISGGQTGADIAGLEFAKEIGIETGGYAPNGYMTENGANYDLRDLYGLKEYGYGYAKRTERNVVESDGTIIFVEKTSPGSVLTLNLCRKYRKPYLIQPDYKTTIKWLNDNRIMVLNIAGNRQSVAAGINKTVKELLKKSIIKE